jgi:hypothetical protein
MMEDNGKYHEFIEENFEKGTEEDVIHIKDMMYIFQNSELRNEKKSQIKQEFLKRGYVYDSKKRKKINKKDKRGFFIGIKQIEDSSDHEVSDSQGQGERRERSERSEEVEDERSGQNRATGSRNSRSPLSSEGQGGCHASSSAAASASLSSIPHGGAVDLPMLAEEGGPCSSGVKGGGARGTLRTRGGGVDVIGGRPGSSAPGLTISLEVEDRADGEDGEDGEDE